jgi:putative tricarboxylic transport membrane protein
MKSCGWPRPPLVLGFILGSMIERYTFISVQRYDWNWLGNKFVLLMFALSILGILQRVFAGMRRSSGRRRMLSLRLPALSVGGGLAFVALAVFVGSLFVEARWPFGARLVPQIISIFGASFALMLLIVEIFPAKGAAGADAAPVEPAERGAGAQALMDFEVPYAGLSNRQIYGRALGYFLWIYAALIVAYLIGLLPALVLFPLVFMWRHGRESWKTALIISLGMFAFLWFVFDRVVHEPWPQSVIGNLFPALRSFLPWF